MTSPSEVTRQERAPREATEKAMDQLLADLFSQFCRSKGPHREALGKLLDLVIENRQLLEARKP